MRVLPGACRRLAPLLLIFCSTLAFACEGLPAGRTFWVRHETAALQLQFDRAIPSEAPPVVMSAAVVEVENAREQVSKGVIQGVLSSDSPQGRINSRLRHLLPGTLIRTRG